MPAFAGMTVFMALSAIMTQSLRGNDKGGLDKGKMWQGITLFYSNARLFPSE